MTRAICLYCAAEKFGCLLPCKSCGEVPHDAHARQLSYAFSNHYIPACLFEDVRARFAAAVAEGRPFTLTAEDLAPEPPPT